MKRNALSFLVKLATLYELVHTFSDFWCLHGFVIAFPNRHPFGRAKEILSSWKEHRPIFNTETHVRVHAIEKSSKVNEYENWISLIELKSTTNELGSPVRKKVKMEGSGPIPAPGSLVEIEYIGTLLGQEEWDPEDVVECWLKEQQGLFDLLEKPMLANELSGSKLIDPNFFTEEYVEKELGLSNKLQRKKTIMAAKRLQKQKEDFPDGTEFDSSLRKGKPFSFVVGEGKVIKGMDLAVLSMRVGERSQLMLRADYGYGSEGYRKANGEVTVPPFANLFFDITLISSSTINTP